MSDARIMICVPCCGRKEVVAQCLPTLVDTLRDAVSGASLHGDVIRCYNDGSRETDAAWLESLGADWAMNFSGMGVDAQRRMHILDFWERADDFTHLLLADSDSFWDEGWRAALLGIQERHDGALVCGYNSATHEGYKNNTFGETAEVLWRRFAPGVSYLMTRETVGRIWQHLPPTWNFDWHIPALLNYKCAVTKTSYTDHVGWKGMHDKPDGPVDGDERALNPTPWLVAKRQQILAALSCPTK